MFYAQAARQAVQARILSRTKREFEPNEWDQNILCDVLRSSVGWLKRPLNITPPRAKRLRYELPKAIDEMYVDLTKRAGVWV